MTERQKEIIYYVLLMVFTLTIGYVSLGKGFHFDTVYSWGEDYFASAAWIKGIQEQGPMGGFFNPRLGAPESSTLLDYPFAGNTMILIIWMISLFVKSTPAVGYVYLIVTFALDGLSMSLLLRKLKVNREASFVISALFAFAPFHFYRYMIHITLIEYAEIPLAIYLCLYIVGVIEEKKWKIVLMAILVGLGYGYYYAFGLILMAVACVVWFIKIENKKMIIKKIWVMLATLGTVLVGLMPKIVYSLVNGANTEPGHREFFDQEIYGLKIIQLLLPVTYSRIDALRGLTEEYSMKAPIVNENMYASLGLIASVGFIILCVALVFSFVSKKKCVGKEWETIDFLSLGTLSIVLTATVGGFGEIFNWAVTSQVRSQNRASIVITAMALVMVALLISRLKAKSKVVSYVVCVVILGIGMFDQVKISEANWQEGIRSIQEPYERYFSEVQKKLPSESMIYQLPYMDYPEVGAINNLRQYELFAGYLFTDDLKWSYGGMKGRNVAAKNLNVDNGMSYTFLTGIKNAGFDAVYIDVTGYEDGGAEILSFYDMLGIEPMISEDGRIYIYDISGIEFPEGAVSQIQP